MRARRLPHACGSSMQLISLSTLPFAAFSSLEGGFLSLNRPPTEPTVRACSNGSPLFIGSFRSLARTSFVFTSLHRQFTSQDDVASTGACLLCFTLVCSRDGGTRGNLESLVGVEARCVRFPRSGPFTHTHFRHPPRTYILLALPQDRKRGRRNGRQAGCDDRGAYDVSLGAYTS